MSNPLNPNDVPSWDLTDLYQGLSDEKLEADLSSIVTDAIKVAIRPFAGVKYKSVFGVAHAIPIDVVILRIRNTIIVGIYGFFWRSWCGIRWSWSIV